MFVRDFLSLHTAPLPFPKTPASKSRVSITSKLIQTKALQAALLTSSMTRRVPQAIEVVSETEQQGLANLRCQCAPRSARRKFAFDHRENSFDLRALPIVFSWKSSVHLVADGPLGDAPARVRRDNAVRSPSSPN